MSSLALAASTPDQDPIDATSPPAPAPPAHDPVVEITIPELVRIEERLAVQAHLGDLHPTHTRRLATVSAELDRRWSTFA